LLRRVHRPAVIILRYADHRKAQLAFVARKPMIGALQQSWPRHGALMKKSTVTVSRNPEADESHVETTRWTYATGVAILFAAYGLVGVDRAHFDKIAQRRLASPAGSVTAVPHPLAVARNPAPSNDPAFRAGR
jgi:hypothetical protein